MRSIALLVVSLSVIVAVINARSLGRSAQLEKIPVEVIYDTEPLETVYTKVIVRNGEQPIKSRKNSAAEKQIEKITKPEEEIVAVVEEVKKEENVDEETKIQVDEPKLVFVETQPEFVPVSVVAEEPVVEVVKDSSLKESMITQVIVDVDGSKLNEEKKVIVSQELLPPFTKPEVTLENNEEDNQNEVNEIDQNIVSVDKVVSEPAVVTEKNVQVIIIEEPDNKKVDESSYTLRFSESHPAQVPIGKATGDVQENDDEEEEENAEAEENVEAENEQHDAEQSSDPTTPKPDRPKPFESIQKVITNIINTVRPSNIVQAIVNRNKESAEKTKDDGESENVSLVNENAEEPQKQEADPPASPISNLQAAFINQIDTFRESVNNALNNLRPTPKPGTESDDVPPRPILDRIQSTVNEGLNGLTQNVNNVFASFSNQPSNADPAAQEGLLQQLQSTVQNNLNQFGQSVNSALSGGQTASGEGQPEKGPAQIIQEQFSSFVNGINNIVRPNQQHSADPVQNEGEAPSQGPFVSIIQNLINTLRPTEKPVDGQGAATSNTGPFTVFQNVINSFRPNSGPNKDGIVDETNQLNEEQNNVEESQQNNEDSESTTHDAVNFIRSDKH